MVVEQNHNSYSSLTWDPILGQRSSNSNLKFSNSAYAEGFLLVICDRINGAKGLFQAWKSGPMSFFVHGMVLYIVRHA